MNQGRIQRFERGKTITLDEIKLKDGRTSI